MADAAATLWDVDSFLVAYEGREGHWELHDGRPILMSAEPVVHGRTKGAAFRALAEAIARASLPCEAFVDSLAVRVDAANAYIPDVLVNCGPLLPGDGMEAVNPVIVLEVLSPSSKIFDRGAKRLGYLGLANVRHYLIVDPERGAVERHFRNAEGSLDSEMLTRAIRLDPPGLDLDVAALLAR